MSELYRHFDREGRLLYVGISIETLGRLRQHSRDSGWFMEIATVTIERHPTREAALAAELVAIRTEDPLYNLAGRAEPVIDDAWEMKKGEFFMEHGRPLPGQGSERMEAT